MTNNSNTASVKAQQPCTGWNGQDKFPTVHSSDMYLQVAVASIDHRVTHASQCCHDDSSVICHILYSKTINIAVLTVINNTQKSETLSHSGEYEYVMPFSLVHT
jgi:hypothetical protein